MGANSYYQYGQIPIFFTFLVCVWAVIGVRLAVFRQNFPGWKSYRGVSMLLILFAGTLCLVYVALLLTNYFLNKSVFNITLQPLPGATGNAMYPNPADFTDAQVATIGGLVGQLAKTIYTSRFILTVALWTVKIAFLFIFLETRSMLGRGEWFLYFTSLFIFISALVALWAVGKDMSAGIPGLRPDAETIRSGVVNTGLRFVFFDDDVEFLLTTMNIATDLCLLIIAWKTIRSFRLPLSDVIFPTCMVGVTISIAIARLPAMVVLMKASGGIVKTMAIPFELLAEAEAFFAVIVACFPGLRQLIRSRKERLADLEILRGTKRNELIEEKDSEFGKGSPATTDSDASTAVGVQSPRNAYYESNPRGDACGGLMHDLTPWPEEDVDLDHELRVDGIRKVL